MGECCVLCHCEMGWDDMTTWMTRLNFRHLTTPYKDYRELSIEVVLAASFSKRVF